MRNSEERFYNIYIEKAFPRIQLSKIEYNYWNCEQTDFQKTSNCIKTAGKSVYVNKCQGIYKG